MQLAPLAFDVSAFGSGGALLHGGRLVQAPDGIPDLADIEHLVRSHAVTTVWLTARLFDRIVDERPSLLATLRQVLTGGEAISVSHVRRALQAMAPGTVLINGYGPDGVYHVRLLPSDPGDPGPDATLRGRSAGRSPAPPAFVLDERAGSVPIGAPGELSSERRRAGGAGTSAGPG